MISMIKKGMISSLRSKIGALLIKPALKSTLKSFDASQYGGAPLLGLKGLVVKTHGSSKANEVKDVYKRQGGIFPARLFRAILPGAVIPRLINKRKEVFYYEKVWKIPDRSPVSYIHLDVYKRQIF